MPAPSPKPVLTLEQVIAQLNRGDAHWDSGPGAVVTFGFFTSVASDYGAEASGFQALNSAQQDAARLALGLWSDLANISFEFEPDQDDAEIRFGNSLSMPSYVGAWAYGPGDGHGGDVWFHATNYTAAPGNYWLYAMIHEIGHALGQPHPGDYNADGTVLSYENNAEYQQDSQQYTIMSYWDASATGATHGGSPASPLLHDIAAIQAKYGANMTTRTGNTVYGFNSTADRAVFDFTQYNSFQAPVLAIWDAGGRDKIDASGYAQNQAIDLHAGAFSDVGGSTANIAIAFGALIEDAAGGAGKDRLVGNDVANLLQGNGGDDLLAGLGGSDTLQGGDGSDTADYELASAKVTVDLNSGTASGGAGSDSLSSIESVLGSAFDDTLRGTSADNLIRGNTGDDKIDGREGIDTADYAKATGSVSVDLKSGASTGADGKDTLTSIENVIGGAYADTLLGTDSANFIAPGAGADTVDGRGGIDTLAFGQIAVNASLATGHATGAGIDTQIANIENLLGSEGDDILSGNNAVNVISGGAGSDILSGLGSNDTLDGGYGDLAWNADNDTVDYSASSAAVRVDLLNGKATGGAIGTDTLIEIESAFGGGGNDIFIGDDQDNSFRGGKGNDTFAGGDGRDTADFSDATSRMVIDLSTGRATGLGNDTFSRIEIVIGGSLDDKITGGAGEDTLFGGIGNDTIDGRGDDDEIHGGDGNDTILGGNEYEDPDDDEWNQNDFIYGEAGNDRIDGQQGHDVIDGGAGDDTLIGGTGKDILTGDEGKDRLEGGAGNDILDGGAGSDTMIGGLGEDTFMVDSITDAVDERAGQGNFDTVDSTISYTLSTYIEGLTLSTLDGQSGFMGIGNESDNVIRGGEGSEVLRGLGGNDQLWGGRGNDRLEGGAGSDTLAFTGGGIQVFVGGQGGDEFQLSNWFGQDVSGEITITDFEHGDRVSMTSFDGIASFADLAARETDDGDDAMFALAENYVLVIENFNLVDLSASDFVFT